MLRCANIFYSRSYILLKYNQYLFQVNGLKLDGADIHDLGLTFHYSPSSAVYQYEVY